MGMRGELSIGRIRRFGDGSLPVLIRWIGRTLCRIVLNPEGGLEPALQRYRCPKSCGVTFGCNDVTRKAGLSPPYDDLIRKTRP